MEKRLAKYQGNGQQMILPLNNLMLQLLNPEERLKIIELVATLLLEAGRKEEVGDESD